MKLYNLREVRNLLCEQLDVYYTENQMERFWYRNGFTSSMRIPRTRVAVVEDIRVYFAKEHRETITTEKG